MAKIDHTTKKGPGRCHVERTWRGTKIDKDDNLPREYPGAKLARKAKAKTLTKIWPGIQREGRAA
jgi:hypothetical protein